MYICKPRFLCLLMAWVSKSSCAVSYTHFFLVVSSFCDPNFLKPNSSSTINEMKCKLFFLFFGSIVSSKEERDHLFAEFSTCSLTSTFCRIDSERYHPCKFSGVISELYDLIANRFVSPRATFHMK